MASRQIVLDTETTGIDPASGHRIIEIGCVELINRRLTNRHFHRYLNPEREIDAGAQNVHGITLEFLADKPFFHEIVTEFLTFIQDAELIIHNAAFDVGFIDHELNLAGHKTKTIDHATVLDTLTLARQMHPGQRNNLDALCKRYNIDNTHRNLHGALLDAEILARVYLAMTGGQATLFHENVGNNQTVNDEAFHLTIDLPNQQGKTPLLQPTADELAAHQNFVDFLQKKSGNEFWSE